MAIMLNIYTGTDVFTCLGLEPATNPLNPLTPIPLPAEQGLLKHCLEHWHAAAAQQLSGSSTIEVGLHKALKRLKAQQRC